MGYSHTFDHLRLTPGSKASICTQIRFKMEARLGSAGSSKSQRLLLIHMATHTIESRCSKAAGGQASPPEVAPPHQPGLPC